MTDVTTTAAVAASAAAPADSITESTTAAVTDLQAYRRQRMARQTAQQSSAMQFQGAHDGWSLSAFHPFAASARTNLR